jgi:hypothetical protein
VPEAGDRERHQPGRGGSGQAPRDEWQRRWEGHPPTAAESERRDGQNGRGNSKHEAAAPDCEDAAKPCSLARD